MILKSRIFFPVTISVCGGNNLIQCVLNNQNNNKGKPELNGSVKLLKPDKIILHKAIF